VNVSPHVIHLLCRNNSGWCYSIDGFRARHLLRPYVCVSVSVCACATLVYLFICLFNLLHGFTSESTKFGTETRAVLTFVLSQMAVAMWVKFDRW
jgi:hypothetical protein